MEDLQKLIKNYTLLQIVEAAKFGSTPTPNQSKLNKTSSFGSHIKLLHKSRTDVDGGDGS